MKCKRCGSQAINPQQHGRESGIDLDLCDVCYWRKQAKAIKHAYNYLTKGLDAIKMEFINES